MASNVSAPDTRVFVFLADKLGGEVDLPETQGSPGAKVDVSVIEVLECDSHSKPTKFGKHLLYEIQTSDFHGSPLHAVKLLEDLCAKDRKNAKFHASLEVDIERCGAGVEGPNKANVFKRTFYQAVLKVLVATSDNCVGFVLILPSSVWGSWKKHLGNPSLVNGDGLKKALLASGENDKQAIIEKSKSWIFVFDVDTNSPTVPNPLKIREMVAASAKSLQEHAFDKAAEEMKKEGIIEKYRSVLTQRIQDSWD